MFNYIIRWSLNNRLLVVGTSLFLLISGARLITRMAVDVLPDLNRPTVTIMTETGGFSPEEVETLVTLPIESLVNGATGVQRVRSFSGIGLSLVFVEFDWGTDIYTDRQIVQEKLQLAQEKLPEGIFPVMGPISSIMGEVMLIGLSATETSPLELRTIADWTIRQRLLAIPGVAQVIGIGGGRKQYQVLASPQKLRAYDLTLKDAIEAARGANINTTGGFLESGQQEYLIRNIGRLTTLEELEQSVVAFREGTPVFLKQVARLQYGPQVKRGDGSVNAKPAVIISIQKQPKADTVVLTRKIDKALDELESALPKDITIHRKIFRQADFIENAIHNVKEALRDGALLLLLVLYAFLVSFRATCITFIALPLSFICTAFVLQAFGISINTMTLGGLAIAIGDLVDSAIVGVENVFRRLRENKLSGHPRPLFDVVLSASVEIKDSIIYATIVVTLVFFPFFFLGGIQGRLLKPLGISYVVSLLASLFVALTVTPALSLYLLPKIRFRPEKPEGAVARWCKAVYARVLKVVLRHPWKVLVVTLVVFLLSLATIPWMGREFFPPFNEGTATINVLAVPGTSLSESNRLGTRAEELLLSIPEIASTARRTGRAELDEHAEGVHYTEIEVVFKHSKRSRDEVLKDIRDKLSEIPGTVLNIGQPISHRLDHMLSGIRAQLAVKFFGPDLGVLRAKAQEIESAMATVPGVVDLQTEKQVLIPQLKIQLKRDYIARYGLTVEEVTATLEAALNGKVVSEVLEQQRTFDVLVRFDEPWRSSIEEIRKVLIDTPTGGRVPITQVADVREDVGPNLIAHENVQRRIVIQCNVVGRDLGGVVADIQRAIAEQVKLPEGYFVTYGGQFEAQEEASRIILGLGAAGLLMVFFILYSYFRSSPVALQVMANLPLAMIGGIISIFLFRLTLSVATMVGFVTLFGVVSRNGIMQISHYIHLMREEGEEFTQNMIIRGSLERLIPILMTALTSFLGLLPLALGKDVTGKEILYPVGIVILGGVFSSTFLTTIVTPSLFWKFGGGVARQILHKKDIKTEV